MMWQMLACALSQSDISGEFLLSQLAWQPQAPGLGGRVEEREQQGWCCDVSEGGDVIAVRR